MGMSSRMEEYSSGGWASAWGYELNQYIASLCFVTRTSFLGRCGEYKVKYEKNDEFLLRYSQRLRDIKANGTEHLSRVKHQQKANTELMGVLWKGEFYCFFK